MSAEHSSDETAIRPGTLFGNPVVLVGTADAPQMIRWENLHVAVEPRTVPDSAPATNREAFPPSSARRKPAA